MSAEIVIAPRVAAFPSTCCDSCHRYRRCVRLWVDRVGDLVVRACVSLCSGCCGSAYDAAKSTAMRRRKATP